MFFPIRLVGATYHDFQGNVPLKLLLDVISRLGFIYGSRVIELPHNFFLHFGNS